MFTFFDESFNTEFIRLYNLKRLREKKVFCVVMNDDIQIITTKTESLKDFYGSFVPLHFYDNSIGYYFSTAYVSDMRKVLGKNFRVNIWFESVTSALSLYKSILTNAKRLSGTDKPTNEYLRLSAVGLQIQTPSGMLNIQNNNHLKRTIFLYEIDSVGDFIQINPTIGRIDVPDSEPYLRTIPEDRLNIPYRETAIIKPIAYNLAYLTLSLNILLVIIGVIIIIKHRNHRMIKCFGKLINYSILFGLTLGTVAISLFLLPPDITKFFCMTRPILISIPLMFILAALQAKASKIMKGYKARKVSKVKVTLLLDTSHTILYANGVADFTGTSDNSFSGLLHIRSINVTNN